MMRHLLFFVCVVISTTSSTLLGAKKCTWGPSYWCVSLKNANECGAYDHCKTAVWSKQRVSNTENACQKCKDIIKKVHDFINSNKTRSEVKNFLDNACYTIPFPELSQKCRKAVDKDYDQIIDMIVSEIDPVFICKALWICPSSKQLVEKLSKSKVKVGPQCILCEFVMREVGNLLRKNSTEREIIEALDKVCSVMPSTVRDECISFVNQYGPAIIQLLATEAPGVICSALGLCTFGNDANPSVIHWLEDEKCEMCKIVVTYLDSMLVKPAIQQDVEKALEKVCHFLPAKDQALCDEIVDKYTPLFIETIAKGIRPITMCNFVQLCDNSKSSILQVNPVLLKPVIKMMMDKSVSSPPKKVVGKKQFDDEEECNVCKLLIKYVTTALSQQSTDKEIEDALEQVCKWVKEPFADQCKEYVDEYGPIILDMLSKELDPTLVCQGLGACPKKAGGHSPSVINSNSHPLKFIPK